MQSLLLMLQISYYMTVNNSLILSQAAFDQSNRSILTQGKNAALLSTTNRFISQGQGMSSHKFHRKSQNLLVRFIFLPLFHVASQRIIGSSCSSYENKHSSIHGKYAKCLPGSVRFIRGEEPSPCTSEESK